VFYSVNKCEVISIQLVKDSQFFLLLSLQSIVGISDFQCHAEMYLKTQTMTNFVEYYEENC
jgi:hypothetical protein